MSEFSIKLAVDVLKSILITLLVAIFGIFGYVFAHYDEISTGGMAVVIISVIALCIAIAIIGKKIFAKIKASERV